MVSGDKSVVLQANKSELKRDGQDIIVVDVFSEAAELPVTVAGAESALTIYPFAGRAQILIRSVEGSDSPITLTVGSASLNF